MSVHKRLLVVAAFAVLVLGVVASPASAAVEILGRGFVPDPAPENGTTSLTVDVTVDQPPYSVEFFQSDPAVSGSTAAKTLAANSPETQAKAGRHTFEFNAGARGTARRIVSVRVKDASGTTNTVSFPFQEPVVPTPPPGPVTLDECPKIVSFVLIKAQTRGGGCWQKKKAGTAAVTENGVTIEPNGIYYTTPDNFTLNGIPFPKPPAGSQYTLVEPTSTTPGGQVGIDKAITVTLGRLPVIRGNFLWKLPTGATQGQLAAFALPSGGVLGGLKVQGDVKVLLRKQGTRFFSSFPLNVQLPPIFRPSVGSTGTVTGSFEIATDDVAGVKLDGAKIDVDQAAIGKLALDKVCLSFLSAGASDQFSACQPPSLNGVPIVKCAFPNRNVERFDGTVVVTLPTGRQATLGAFAGLAGGNLQQAGAFIDNAGIPIVQGINLERVGFGLCVNPLNIKGLVGVSIGGGILRADASLQYAEVGRGFFVEVQGFVRVFGQEIGNGRVRVESSGAVDFDAAAKLNVLNGAITLEASVNGFMVPRPFRFNVEGKGEACIVILGCGGIQGIVSSVGVSGCASAKLFKFIPLEFSGFFEFKTKKFQSGTGCGFATRARIRRRSAVAAQAGVVTFDVPKAQKQYVVHIKGDNAPPKVQITSPSGKTFSSSQTQVAASDKKTFLILENKDQNETDVFLAANATPGTWKAQALPGSTLNGQVEEQETEKKPTLLKGVARAVSGGKRAIDLIYYLKPGETVQLDVTGDKYQQTLASGLRGKKCPAKRTLPGRSASESRCQTITYTPAFGYAGARNVVATIVDAQKRPVQNVVVAKYRAANPPLPTKPPDVRIVRQGTNVFVVWGSSTLGVTRYAAYAQVGDGRELGFTSPATCKAWLIPDVDPDKSVTARVQAGRKDMELGSGGSVTLAAGVAFAGPAKLAKAKIPPTCSPVP